MKALSRGNYLSAAAILLFNLLFPLVRISPAAAMGGSGTAENPYVITTCADLQDVDNDLTANYTLGATIDCDGVSGFTPIGAGGDPFTGTFDGQMYAVKNLSILAARGGLFDALDGAEVRNLVLANSVQIEGIGGAGSLAYEALDAHIASVFSSAQVGSGSDTGGLVAHMAGGNISGSLFNGGINVSAVGTSSGGLVGVLAGGVINDSYTQAGIIMWGNNNVGGVVGMLSDGTLTRVYGNSALGNVPESSLGGLVGLSDGTGGSAIYDSFAAAPVGSDGTSLSGAVYGATNDAITFGGVYYDQTGTGQTICGNVPDPECTAVNTDGSQGDYFFSSANAPLDQWDFGGTAWMERGYTFPLLWMYEVPSTPQNLEGTAVNAATVTLEWTQSSWYGSSTFNGYSVYYKQTSDDDTHWEYLYYAPEGTVAVSVGGLMPSTSYDFRVTAYNDNDESAPSAPVTVVLGPRATHHISTCQQLQDMDNDLSANYILDNDIDCSDTVHWNGGAGFIPVGAGFYYGYSGTFDGQGYRIKNLFIDRSGSNDAGLFAWVQSGTVRNLRMSRGSMKADGISGAVAAYAYNATFDNVRANSAVTVAGAWGLAGGLAGEFDADDRSLGMITGSGFDGTVTSSWMAGGLAAYVWNVTIAESYNTGTLTGVDSVGGLIGQAEWSDISRVFTSGAVQGSGTSIGGLIGQLGNNTTLHDGYASGAVTAGDGSSSVGGLVGFLIFSHVYNSYASGSVAIDGEATEVGGLIGRWGDDATVFDSFSAALVAQNGDDPYTGAFSGMADNIFSSSAALGSYVDMAASGQASVCGQDNNCSTVTQVNTDGTEPGLFLANVVQPPLDQWDFGAIWGTTAGYPVLRFYQPWHDTVDSEDDPGDDSDIDGASGGHSPASDPLRAIIAAAGAGNVVQLTTSEPNPIVISGEDTSAGVGTTQDAGAKPARGLLGWLADTFGNAGGVIALVIIIPLLWFVLLWARRRDDDEDK